jgi:DNA-binding IclR family transcriptional regulator
MKSLPVKSAARALELLELFANEARPHSLKEVRVKLKYPQSSTSTLMKSLTSLGYLNYDRSRRVYFPTLRVTRLGDWIPNALFGQGRILALMQQLHERTGENVGIGVLNDVYVQYVKMILSNYAMRVHVEEGFMRIATRTPAGWILLAAKSNAEVDKLVRRANISVSDRSERVNVNDFVKMIGRVRRAKYAYAEHMPLPGAAAVCVSIPIKLQGQSVALGIGGLADRLQPRLSELVQVLHESAAAIAEEASSTPN